MRADLNQQLTNTPQQGAPELQNGGLKELAVPLGARRPLSAGRELLGRANERVLERIQVLDKLAIGSEKQIEIDRRELGRVLAAPRAAELVKAVEQRIAAETTLLQEHRHRLNELGEMMRRSAELLLNCEQLEHRADKLEGGGYSADAGGARAMALETLRRAYAYLNGKQALVGDSRFNELLERLRGNLRRVSERSPSPRRTAPQRPAPSGTQPEKLNQAAGGEKPGPAHGAKSDLSIDAPPKNTAARMVETVPVIREMPVRELSDLKTPVRHNGDAVKELNVVQREAVFARESEVWASVNTGLRAANVIAVLPPVETEWIEVSEGVECDPSRERGRSSRPAAACSGPLPGARGITAKRFYSASRSKLFRLLVALGAGAAAAALIAEVV